MRPRYQAKRGYPPLREEPPVAWDDVRNPSTLTRRGSNDKPDFDYTNLGLLFPEDDETEVIYISDQMPHAWRGTDGRKTVLRPHVHYVQDETSIPVFELQYRFYRNGTTVPSFTTIDTSSGAGAVFTYATGSILQIVRFPWIEFEGGGPSTWYDMLFYRQTGDGVTGDVLVKGFDWHAQFDAIGSRKEYVK
jgi:hypothetical protein